MSVKFDVRVVNAVRNLLEAACDTASDGVSRVDVPIKYYKQLKALALEEVGIRANIDVSDQIAYGDAKNAHDAMAALLGAVENGLTPVQLSRETLDVYKARVTYNFNEASLNSGDSNYHNPLTYYNHVLRNSAPALVKWAHEEMQDRILSSSEEYTKDVSESGYFRELLNLSSQPNSVAVVADVLGLPVEDVVAEIRDAYVTAARQDWQRLQEAVKKGDSDSSCSEIDRSIQFNLITVGFYPDDEEFYQALESGLTREAYKEVHKSGWAQLPTSPMNGFDFR